MSVGAAFGRLGRAIGIVLIFSIAGPLEKYSASVIAGAQSCPCRLRANWRRHSGQVQGTRMPTRVRSVDDDGWTRQAGRLADWPASALRWVIFDNTAAGAATANALALQSLTAP